MNITKTLIILGLILITASCSSKDALKDIAGITFTNETAYSTRTNISVQIPEGWFTAEENEYNSIDLWLIKEDYSATLNFNLINFDQTTLAEIKNKKIAEAADFSKLFVRAQLGKDFTGFTDEQTFKIGSNEFYSYSYSDKEKKIIRVVVFKHKDKYYELTALPAGINNPAELHRIQNAVLSTLK